MPPQHFLKRKANIHWKKGLQAQKINAPKAKCRSLQRSWLSATCLRTASSLGSVHGCTNNDCEYNSPLPWRSPGNAYLN